MTQETGWICPHCKQKNIDLFNETTVPLCEQCNHAFNWWDVLPPEEYQKCLAIRDGYQSAAMPYTIDLRTNEQRRIAALETALDAMIAIMDSMLRWQLNSIPTHITYQGKQRRVMELIEAAKAAINANPV